MKKLFGNSKGLKANQIRSLENLYRRRVSPESVITFEIARDISRLSHELRRQIGLLITRRGKIISVIVGNHQRIVIPNTIEFRSAPGRLRGIRCVHTHLGGEGLTPDDLTDLALLRLDIMAAITIDAEGRPLEVHVGHILPQRSEKTPYRILTPLPPNRLDIGCIQLIQALEEELSHSRALYRGGESIERALLVSVSTGSQQNVRGSLAELEELAATSGIEAVGTVLQHRHTPDSRFLMGRGKLSDLSIMALQSGATLIVFDQELNPSQIRSMTDQIDLKVIDRTQLILDIFAQRAQTREGKLQVELAQLKYLLPRLIAKNTAMSRLTGGIGGRGPGETKLEIHRRRARDRIVRLEKELLHVQKQRKQQKAMRRKRGLPVISIVGYTNAGKSTLLNTLTKSNVFTAEQLFATLDPSSRRLKFPQEIEVIITDTVGFIRDLPQDLLVAFRATLEELESADLLLHVIDISNPRVEEQIASVETILSDLKLQDIALLRVFNKQDLIDPGVCRHLTKIHNGIPICAKDKSSLMPLILKMEDAIQRSLRLRDVAVGDL